MDTKYVPAVGSVTLTGATPRPFAALLDAGSIVAVMPPVALKIVMRMLRFARWLVLPAQLPKTCSNHNNRADLIQQRTNQAVCNHELCD
jgi:hypothetical protein